MRQSCAALAAMRFGVGTLTEEEATTLFELLAKVRRPPPRAVRTSAS